MSIDAKIDRLITGVEALTEIFTKVANGQDAIIAAAKEAAGKSGGTKAAGAGAKAKDEPKTDTAKTNTSSAGDGEKAVTFDDVKKIVGDWAADGSEKETTARKAKLKELFATIAEKTGKTVTKLGEVPEERYGSLIKAINTLKEKGNLVQDDDDGGEGDDDLI